MNWKAKAWLQRVIAALPNDASLAMYYWLQRSIGGLRTAAPLADVRYGVELVRHLKESGKQAAAARFLEVGTGRRVNLPLTWWLCGAGPITTVDLYPYLKLELILEDLATLQKQADQLRQMLGADLDESRLQRLLDTRLDGLTLAQCLAHFDIRYLSGVDASALPIASGEIDVHASNNVLEHIPGEVIPSILNEGCRVLSSAGRFVHRVNFSDHFARGNSGISSVNFLTFNQRDWDRIAGNRFMYMNRLRVDDMDRIFEAGGVELLGREVYVCQEAAALLRSAQLRVDREFEEKSVDVLSTHAAWYVGRAAVQTGASSSYQLKTNGTANLQALKPATERDFGS